MLESFDRTETHGVDIQGINDKLRSVFLSGKSKNIKWRKEQLVQVKRLGNDNRNEITDCNSKDFGRYNTFLHIYFKSQHMIIITTIFLGESVETEILSTISEVDFALEKFGFVQFSQSTLHFSHRVHLNTFTNRM